MRVPRHTPDVLLLSLRKVEDVVAYCAQYEFEDVISSVMDAETAAPEKLDAVELSRKAYKLVRYLSGSRKLAGAAVRPLAPRRRGGEYDLFLPVFSHPHQLFALSCVPDWRKRCRKAVCFIVEAWAGLLPGYLLELLSDFDHVFIAAQHVIGTVSKLIGRPCTYMPQGVDALRFCPWPDPPVRSIDVCNIGRRSPVTHRTLLERARQGRIFYYYDTIKPAAKQVTFHVSSGSEHRLLLANLLKRSRYFIANRARANEPELTRGRDEIAGRFFEGAAAGTIILGDPPDIEEFRSRFDWPDAVIPMPFDARDVLERIEELDADPHRQERIRRENARNALLRHDWIHRLRTILDAVGVAPSPGMLAREARLASLAAAIR
ncbi:MAG: glycosyltransferase [Myxococcales bacterium]